MRHHGISKNIRLSEVFVGTNMAIITVYHGTTFKRAKKIIADKKIKITSFNIARYDDTTNGYIYVTSELHDAIGFSTRPILGEDVLTIVVFKIQIDTKELMTDADEEKWQSTLDVNDAKKCYRIKRDLLIGKDVVAVFCKKMPSHNAIGNYMQALQYGEKEVKESEWKVLCHD